MSKEQHHTAAQVSVRTARFSIKGNSSHLVGQEDLT